MNARDKAANQGPSTVIHRRDKTTKRSVILLDRLADWTITIGGLGVIAAVLGIMIFLANVVVPLFTGSRVEGQGSVAVTVPADRVLAQMVDEHRAVAVSILATGELQATHIRTGQTITASSFDFGGREVSAFDRSIDGRELAFGFADGHLMLARLNITANVIPAADLPEGLARISDRELTDGQAIYTAIPGDQYRVTAVRVRQDEPQAVSDRPIQAIDYRIGGTVERPTRAFVTVDAAGVARISRSESRRNLLTGKETLRLSSAVLPGLPPEVEVAKVLMSSNASAVYIAARDGTVFRYDARNFDAPLLVEEIDLSPEGGNITLFEYLIGEQSLVVGGSDGSVRVFFRLPREDARSKDGQTLVLAHDLEPQGAEVTHISVGQRGKMFATADAAGEIWVRHSTSEQTLLKLRAENGEGFRTLSLAPRQNAVVALDRLTNLHIWAIDAPHPETTLGTIFGKVWYEGYAEPTYTWQSSSGNDSFEPKLSLVPLIFGTIKATVYSLLFAIPIALGAAIYTSEFVHARVRGVVKPTMEMMASLPSVVLGFIAALILAPIVETWIAAVVLAFIAIPLGLLIAAYLWQLVPGPVALRYGNAPKFLLMIGVILLFGYIAYQFAPFFERLLFAGDFKAWANGDIGSSLPFTTFLLAPVIFILVYFGMERLAGRWLDKQLRRRDRLSAGLFDLARWIVTVAVTFGLAYPAAALLVAVGLDPRGGVIDTYAQRNTLIIGFAMGFAVIPIIYTIAEDALNAVPEHLRAAALGCGATPWQMAISVILPTAMSGIFAAVMIGMGRAVGETMIVVMAAGNTPLMDWNIFNGLRALSANIAVELPEAVKDSTLYRMLFLAALVLFVMTFVVNTAAEVIRQRFRKRAAQL